MAFLLLALSLVFVTAGQVLQKLAATRASAGPAEVQFVVRLLRRPETWLAVSSLGLGMACWLGVLYHMEVSRAFPFLSLGFVMVLLAARLQLHEKIGPRRWAGVGLIVAGVALLSLP